jgi:hypothetical protein
LNSGYSSVAPVSVNVRVDVAGAVATFPPVALGFVDPPVECELQAAADSINNDAAANLPKRNFTFRPFVDC